MFVRIGEVKDTLLQRAAMTCNLPPMRTAPSPPELLAEIVAGKSISRTDAVRLMSCSDDELPLLLDAAQQLRAKHKGSVISFSRKVFLPLTNLCRDYCGYCTFRRDPGQPGAHTMTPEEVLAVATQGEQLGCTEALFSLGDKPEAIFPEMQEILRRLGYKSTLHYLEAMCELVLRETKLIPHANPGLMSAEWLRRLRDVSPSIGLMLESTNASLAAHADRTPDKLPSKRLAVIKDAGKLGIPFTTGILIGIGESIADRVDSLFAIRELHDRYGHVQEVIIQNFRAKPGIPMSSWPEPTEGDMLRTTAVARLILRDMNVQAPPNLSVPNYPRLLDAGINDWGGISPLTPDFINPEAPWPHLHGIEAQTRARGFALKQRLPVYPEFLDRSVECSPKSATRLRELADADGYARPSISVSALPEAASAVHNR
jgi:7,8-didemethyl-8-hydroxy-5-deazariboflavin synthase CofG subunit